MNSGSQPNQWWISAGWECRGLGENLLPAHCFVKEAPFEWNLIAGSYNPPGFTLPAICGNDVTLCVTTAGTQTKINGKRYEIVENKTLSEVVWAIL